MPPKVKNTKEDIVNATVELVRKNGQSAINARAVAAFLGCSTQPVFSNFGTMDELKQAIILAAYNIYLEFIQNEIQPILDKHANLLGENGEVRV